MYAVVFSISGAIQSYDVEGSLEDSLAELDAIHAALVKQSETFRAMRVTRKGRTVTCSEGSGALSGGVKMWKVTKTRR